MKIEDHINKQIFLVSSVMKVQAEYKTLYTVARPVFNDESKSVETVLQYTVPQLVFKIKLAEG